jgi:hypothetical protein
MANNGNLAVIVPLTVAGAVPDSHRIPDYAYRIRRQATSDLSQRF